MFIMIKSKLIKLKLDAIRKQIEFKYRKLKTAYILYIISKIINYCFIKEQSGIYFSFYSFLTEYTFKFFFPYLFFYRAQLKCVNPLKHKNICQCNKKRILYNFLLLIC